MSVINENLTKVKWFNTLTIEVRYQFASQWMSDEAGGISSAKLSQFLQGEKHYSEALIKSLRSYDLENHRLKNVWRPVNGFSLNDIYHICTAINSYRKKNGRIDRVTADSFYEHAWSELNQQYPYYTLTESITDTTFMNSALISAVAFETRLYRAQSLENLYALNNQNELTHLSVNGNSNIDLNYIFNVSAQ